jgi:hypothetical protein
VVDASRKYDAGSLTDQPGYNVKIVFGGARSLPSGLAGTRRCCVTERNSQLMRLSSATIVVLAAAGLPACSSTSHAKSAPTTTSARSSTTAAGTTSASGATDRATVRDIVLKATDLPGTWKVGPIEPNSNSGDAQMTHCLGIPNSDTSQTAYAGSPDFQQGTVTIFSQTTVYTSTAVVGQDLRGAASPNLARCFSQLFATQVSGATNIRIVRSLLPASAGALKGFRLKGSFTVTQGGRNGSAAFDEVALAKGRIELNVVILEQAGSVLPPGLMERATGAIAQRLNSHPLSGG